MQHHTSRAGKPDIGRRFRKLIPTGAAVALAVASVSFLIWYISRPPSNARDAGLVLAKNLQASDIERIEADIWPDEIKTLNMSKSQVDAVLQNVFCPEFRKLGIDTHQLKETGSGYQWYTITPCTSGNAKTQLIFGFYQIEPKRFYTTLTNLYIGLDRAELSLAQKQGTTSEYGFVKQRRDDELSRLGMPGLCDMRNRSVWKWTHPSSR